MKKFFSLLGQLLFIAGVIWFVSVLISLVKYYG